MPPWTNDWLTLLNTIDTALGVVFLTASWFGLRAWLNSRRAQAGSQDEEADEVAQGKENRGY